MASITVPKFDSRAVDTLTDKLDRLEGLASCFAALTYAEAEGNLNHVLIDKALPQLALAMQDLATDCQAATQRLWSQYTEVRTLIESVNHG